MNQVKVNIPRTVQDPEYRYKMPLLQQRIIGRGINIRTEFLNLKEVARDLFIGPEYILKFMGIEFGSKSTLKRNQKTNEIQVTSINGKFSSDDVLACLDKFIDKFILCQKDKLPEMRISVDKGEVVGKCNSCGHLNKIDPTHKLTAYIQKHPPKQITDIQGVKDEEDEQDREYEKQIKQTNTNIKKYQIRERLKNTKLDPKNLENSEIFESIWKYLGMIMQIDDDYKYEDTQTENIYKAVKRLRMKKEYYDKVGFIVFNFLFDDKIFTQIDSRAILFEQFLIRHRMEEFVPHETALNLTFFCYSVHKEQSWDKYLPTMMKKLLDQDLFSKEFLLKWEAKDSEIMSMFNRHCLYVEESNEKILKVCQPFFSWLKSESDDESEEGSEEEGSEEEEESEEDNQ